MSPMTEHDQSKKFAEKSAATANKAFATVEQSTRAVEQSYSVSLENIRAFNLKMIDMARANVEAVLDLSQQIAQPRRHRMSSSCGRRMRTSNSRC